MLQLLSEDQVANGSAEPSQYVEAIVPADLPSLPSPTDNALESIRIGLRDVASKTALQVKQLSQETVQQALQMGQQLWRMQRDLKRKEYGVFLSILGWATTKARKFINLAKTFEGFEPSQLIQVELTTLLGLSSSRYSSVIARLRETKEITQQLVEQLIKENRPSRKPKQDPISGWKQNRVGGTRRYEVILHDEETGLSIEQQAEESGVLPQRVITEAIALLSQQKSSVQPNEYRAAQLEELQTVVENARTLDRENRKLALELQKRDHTIALLEAKLTFRPAGSKAEPEDEAAIASWELDEYLEEQVPAIAAEYLADCPSQPAEASKYSQLEQESSYLEPTTDDDHSVEPEEDAQDLEPEPQVFREGDKESAGVPAIAAMWFSRAKELGLVLDYTTIGEYTVRQNYRKLGAAVQKWDINNNSWWENQRQISSLGVDDGDGTRYDTPQEAVIALAILCKVIEKDGAESDFFGASYEPVHEHLIEQHQEFLDDINQEARSLPATATASRVRKSKPTL